MITEFKDFDNIVNEGVHVMSIDKLRDSLKDIMMTEVNRNDFITVKKVVDLLSSKYNINISEAVLDDILDKWDKKDYSVFTKKDKNWMEYFSFRKEIKRPSKHTTNVFGKGRSKSDTTNINYGRNTNYTGTSNTTTTHKGRRWNGYGYD